MIEHPLLVLKMDERWETVEGDTVVMLLLLGPSVLLIVIVVVVVVESGRSACNRAII
jgi:hypothetical protein